MTDVKYKVLTVYDDGFESIKEFSTLGDAKSYFGNVDERDIQYSILSECGDGDLTEIARKEGKQRK